jgi:hypothetical protein
MLVTLIYMHSRKVFTPSHDPLQNLFAVRAQFRRRLATIMSRSAQGQLYGPFSAGSPTMQKKLRSAGRAVQQFFIWTYFYERIVIFFKEELAH